jgi:hypothetical protein
MTKRLTALTALLVATTPALAQGQTLGWLDWVGTGSSFSASFQTGSQTVTAYAGAAYRANALVPGTAPWYLQASNGFGPAVDILCIDFLHTAQTVTYQAYFTNLAFDNLTRTRGADLSQYQRAAWLSTQMETLPFTNAGRQDRAEVHAAIWQILAGTPTLARANIGSGSSYAGSDVAIANWISLANANYLSVNLAQFTVVTAECVDRVGHAGDGFRVADSCSQEFLVRNTTVTPEPGAILLLATGLMAVAGVGFIRRRTVPGISTAA